MKATNIMLALAALLAALTPTRPAAAQLNADQVLTDMGLSAADRQKVMDGQFVTVELSPVSDRDLSIGIAFVVKTTPAELSKEVVAGELLKADAQIQAHGDLTGGAGGMAGLRMADDTAKAFAGASGGSSLNLATEEIAAFNGLKGAGTPAVQQQLQKMLLARFESYRSAGLAGIAPYDRGGSSSDPGADLRRAAEAAAGLKKYLPGLQKMLIGYPQASLPGADQTFHWVQYSIDGTPTYVLTHLIAATDGDARVLAQRQFYVSTGYNAVQTVAGFLPVAEGTVVVYTNHTFTDQVAGFGGSMKRKIGRGMMETQLQKIFTKAKTLVQ